MRNVRSALQMLWGGVLFVVAHRGGQHRQPVAGARQRPHEGAGDAQRDRRRRAARIAKQLITEATLLTLIGAGLGIGLGFLSLNAIEWIGFTDLPRRTRSASTAWCWR